MQPTKFVPRDLWMNLLGLFVMFALIALALHYFSIETMRGYIAAAGIWAPVLLVVAKASTIVIAPLGGSPLYPVAGALFGFWLGSALLILGDALGGIIAFFLSRYFGRALVERILGRESEMLEKALALMSTTRGYLLARICFIAIPEFASYGAGLTRIGLLPFFIIYTSIGAIPSLILAGLGDLLTTSGSVYLLPLVMVAGGVISAIALALFYKLMQRAETSAPH